MRKLLMSIIGLGALLGPSVVVAEEPWGEIKAEPGVCRVEPSQEECTVVRRLLDRIDIGSRWIPSRFQKTGSWKTYWSSFWSLFWRRPIGGSLFPIGRIYSSSSFYACTNAEPITNIPVLCLASGGRTPSVITSMPEVIPCQHPRVEELRTIYGTHHSVSPVHLDRYLDDATFRFNTRKMSDRARFTATVAHSEGRRLTYEALTGKQRTA
jgi:hypothetical protein